MTRADLDPDETASLPPPIALVVDCIFLGAASSLV